MLILVELRRRKKSVLHCATAMPSRRGGIRGRKGSLGYRQLHGNVFDLAQKKASKRVSPIDPVEEKRKCQNVVAKTLS